MSHCMCAVALRWLFQIENAALKKAFDILGQVCNGMGPAERITPCSQVMPLQQKPGLHWIFLAVDTQIQFSAS